MRHVGDIATRELRSFFSTPVAYVLLGMYLVFVGYIFFANLGVFLKVVQEIQQYGRLDLLAEWSLNQQVIQPTFQASLILFLILTPLLAMRVFSEERAQSTIELLLTSPLTIWEIVIGKYLAVLAMVGLMVLFTGFYPLLLTLYGNPELLPVISGLLLIFLYGASLAAMACFVSSLTKSQAVAAIVSIVIGIVLMILGPVAEYTVVDSAQATLRYLSTQTHMQEGMVGVIRSQDVMYFLGFIAFSLMLLRTSVESLRWR